MPLLFSFLTRILEDISLLIIIIFKKLLPKMCGFFHLVIYYLCHIICKLNVELLYPLSSPFSCHPLKRETSHQNSSLFTWIASWVFGIFLANSAKRSKPNLAYFPLQKCSLKHWHDAEMKTKNRHTLLNVFSSYFLNIIHIFVISILTYIYLNSFVK